MKTHDFAKQLTVLAKALRALPNIEVEQLGNLQAKGPNLAVGLSTLTSLAEIEKAQWIDFIRQHDLPIEVRARDASRDIVGKIMNYLQTDKDARNRIANAAASSRGSVSSELQRAFDILLRP